MIESARLPLAKNNDMVVTTVGNEVLIYNLITHKAFNLNETSSIVYNACNGKTTFDELKRKNCFTDDLIHFSLEQLRKENLIEAEESNHFAGLSRREVIKKVGLGTMIALPVISALIAPAVAHAASSSACLIPGVCYRAGTIYCPPSCNRTLNFNGYPTTNGTCGTPSYSGTVDCSDPLDKGVAATNDLRFV